MQRRPQKAREIPKRLKVATCDLKALARAIRASRQLPVVATGRALRPVPKDRGADARGILRTLVNAFDRYIGIDYSAAQTPTSSLKGLRVYWVDGAGKPEEVAPQASPRRYWTRRGLAECLAERLKEPVPTLVGIDHGFSFPFRYFEIHGLIPDWPAFLEDFQRHWPTDGDHVYVDFVCLFR